LRGGSFLGKKNSSKFRKSDFQRGSSKISRARSRCSSGSLPGAFVLICSDPIVPVWTVCCSVGKSYPNYRETRSLHRCARPATSCFQFSPFLCTRYRLAAPRTYRAKFSFTNCNSVWATTTVHFVMQSNSRKDMSLPPMTRRVDVAGLAPYNEGIQSFKRGH